MGLSRLITLSRNDMVHVAREMERQGFMLLLLIGGRPQAGRIRPLRLRRTVVTGDSRVDCRPPPEGLLSYGAQKTWLPLPSPASAARTVRLAMLRDLIGQSRLRCLTEGGHVN
jgi:hypothetical protein